MKVAFFHDARLVYGGNGQIYSTGFTYSIWERYLSVFDSIIISTRMKIDDTIDSTIIKNMGLSSGPKVEFEPITEYNNNSDMILNRRAISSQIKKVLDECDCAIIRLPSTIGEIACVEAEKIKRPYLVEVVGCPFDSLWNHSLKGKLIAIPKYIITKRRVKKAPYAIYVTNEFLQRRYPCNGRIIGCSDVALTEFNDNILNKRIDKINNLQKDSKLIIGTVAAVDVRYKGQQFVIKAISELKKQGISNVEYHLVGGGDNSYLKNIAKKYGVINEVKFLGPLPHQEIFEFLNNVDLYVQLSKQEGLPRAVVEAMSRGCPIIGSTAGGIPELIDKEFLVRPKDSKELSRKILELVRNKDLMKEQATRNYEKSKEYSKNILDIRREEFLKDFKLYSMKVRS